MPLLTQRSASPRVTEILNSGSAVGVSYTIIGGTVPGAVAGEISIANYPTSGNTLVQKVQHVDNEGRVLQQSTQDAILAQILANGLAAEADLSVTLLNAVTSPGAGATTDTSGYISRVVQVVITGVASVQIQGSLNGTSWFTIGDVFTVSDGMTIGHPVRYMRALYASGTGTVSVFLYARSR